MFIKSLTRFELIREYPLTSLDSVLHLVGHVFPEILLLSLSLPRPKVKKQSILNFVMR